MGLNIQLCYIFHYNIHVTLQKAFRKLNSCSLDIRAYSCSLCFLLWRC